jgi:hypothetical protein
MTEGEAVGETKSRVNNNINLSTSHGCWYAQDPVTCRGFPPTCTMHEGSDFYGIYYYFILTCPHTTCTMQEESNFYGIYIYFYVFSIIIKEEKNSN